MRVTIASPRPVPPGFVVKNGWATLDRSSGGIPGPSSSTSSQHCPSAGGAGAQDHPPLRAGGIDRIKGQIAHRLTDLIRVGPRLDLRTLHHHGRTGPAGEPEIPDDVGGHLLEFHSPQVEILRARVGQKRAHESLDVLHLTLDHLEQLGLVGVEGEFLGQDLHRAAQRQHAVANLVSDAGGEFADRGQPIAPSGPDSPGGERR